MKNLFKKLFGEKIISFKEGGNILIELLMRFPFLKEKLPQDIYTKKRANIRIIFSVLAQIGKCLLEFGRKGIYAIVFLLIPYLILASECPNIKNAHELTIMYLFIILSAFCGSITNNTLFTMADRDFLMTRVILISQYMNFLGKLMYKMLSDFIYFTIILCILGVSFKQSILLNLVTLFLRPVGELIGILCYDIFKKAHSNRGTINGLLMAASVIVAYLIPFYNRNIPTSWYNVTGPIFIIISFIIGAGSMYCLWYYKSYKRIMSEAMYIKRES